MSTRTGRSSGKTGNIPKVVISGLSSRKEGILTGSLPTMIDREDFLLVHAGLHPEYGLQTPVEWATIIRDHIDHRPWYESYTGSKRIIYGHWAAQ